MTLNNSGSSIYDLQAVYATSAAGGAQTVAAAKWTITCAGASCASGTFSVFSMKVPNFTGTVANKHVDMQGGIADATAANNFNGTYQLGFRSTSAVTRLAVAAAVSGKKLKVGSQILIYKRRSS